MSQRPQREWNRATRIEAEAQGPSCQRAFRLLVETGGASALLGIEKEPTPLSGNAGRTASDRIFPRSRSAIRTSRGKAPPAGQGFPSSPDISFQVARLSLGIDEERDLFVLLAYDSEQGDDSDPTFGCLVTRPQLRRLSRQIAQLVAAGRPRCPLCQAPSRRRKPSLRGTERSRRCGRSRHRVEPGPCGPSLAASLPLRRRSDCSWGARPAGVPPEAERTSAPAGRGHRRSGTSSSAAETSARSLQESRPPRPRRRFALGTGTRSLDRVGMLKSGLSCVALNCGWYGDSRLNSAADSRLSSPACRSDNSSCRTITPRGPPAGPSSPDLRRRAHREVDHVGRKALRDDAFVDEPFLPELQRRVDLRFFLFAQRDAVVEFAAGKQRGREHQDGAACGRARFHVG